VTKGSFVDASSFPKTGPAFVGQDNRKIAWGIELDFVAGTYGCRYKTWRNKPRSIIDFIRQFPQELRRLFSPLLLAIACAHPM
jgi:hypothetical protein